jgi:RimJ/RimL family protein N-acetyltransferase
VTADDTAALHTLWTSPGVRRYLWDDEIVSRERTDDVIATSDRLFEQNDFGLWVMRERIDKSLAGVTGLYPFRETHDVELVFAVEERLWGHGYAAEAAHAVIEYCFTTLQMPTIRASTDAENAASARVLEKLGFTQTRRATVGRIDTLFYERAR